MFNRNFNPETVALDEDITVERTGSTTVLNVPRNLSDFRGEPQPANLGQQLRQFARAWF